MQDHARFSITGTVTRVWVADSGKFGTLSVSVPVGDGKTRKIDMRAFSAVTPSLQELSPGMRVNVVGDVEMNPLKDKQKNDVKVDNFTKWVVELTAREVKQATGGARAPRPAPASVKPLPPDGHPAGDTDIPF